MIKRIFLLVFLWLIFIAQTAQAQQSLDIVFTHLTSKEGLPDDSAFTMLQDSRGFIWVGTRNGLARYDGYQFTIYRPIPGNPNSLSDADVRAVVEDDKGNLWIGTETGGLNKFNPFTGKFTRYLHDPNNPNSLSDNRIRKILLDPAGYLWIGTDLGLNKFDPTTLIFTRYINNPDDPNSLTQVRAWNIDLDKNGAVWVGTGGGLDRLDPATGRVTHIFFDRQIPTTPDSASRIYIDPAGLIWLGTPLGVVSYEPATETFNRYANQPAGLTDFVILSIFRDHSGIVWVGTWGDGLYEFDPQSDRFDHHPAERVPGGTLLGDAVVSIYQDHEGLLWIGTRSGLNMFNPAQRQFTNYQHQPENPDSIVNGIVRAIKRDNNGIIWIATGMGLARFDPVNQQWTQYQTDPENPNSLSGNDLYDICSDGSKGLWIASRQGLNHLDAENGQFLQYLKSDEPDDNSLSDNFTQRCTIDSNGILWIGQRETGLDSFDPRTGQFQNFRNDLDDPQSLSANGVLAIHQDANGTMWIGTDQGLNRFNATNGTFTHFLYEGVPVEVYDILDSASSRLWVGTSQGLFALNLDGKTLAHYTTQNGLPDNNILDMEADRQGNLWLGTSAGLVKFNPEDETSITFDTADGLPGDVFTQNASGQTASGEMMFGSTNTLITFFPDQVRQNSYQPPIVITQMRLFSQVVEPGAGSVLQQPIWTNPASLKLNYDQNFFSFDFSALSYVAPDQNRYRYRLEGLSDEWIEVNSDRRVAAFTSVPPGNYILQIQGTNNNGLWSQNETLLKVTVTPPWWQTMWFRAAAIFLLTGVIFGGFRYRVNIVQQRNRVLEGLVLDRTQELAQQTDLLVHSNRELALAKDEADKANLAKSIFLANMSHELRTPLNSILGYAQILRRQMHNDRLQQDGVEIIYSSGNHLLTLIEDVLDIAKIEANRLSLVPVPVSLPSFLDEIVNIMQMSAREKGLPLIFDPPADLPDAILVDTKRLRQVLLNLIGNAIKFTEDGQVTLKVTNAESTSAVEPGQVTLRFEVADTGMGIDSDEQLKIFLPFEQGSRTFGKAAGTGLGLAISQQIVNRMGGRIEAASEPGNGSVFWFTISVSLAASLADKALARQSIKGYEGQRRRLLIADDKRDNRLVLARMLEPLGFDVILATNGKEAIEQAARFKPDLILIDLVMPVMTGFEAVPAIRALPELATLPIIAISASTMNMDQEHSQRVGCNDFLTKPVALDRLLAMMQHYLALHWIMEAPPDEETVEVVSEENAPIYPPDQEDMEQLYELASLGDITGLHSYLNHLREASEKYTAFTDQVLQLADHYDFRQIQSFLQKYIQ